MIRLPAIEIILRGIPEGLIFILAAYVFSKTKVSINRYILSSLLFGIITYFIRFLPIDSLINSILSMILCIILATKVNRINIVKSIQLTIMNFIIMFLCEGINVIIIKFIFKKDINVIIQNPMLSAIYTSPSLLIFAGVIAIYYFMVLKKGKPVYNSGETIS